MSNIINEVVLNKAISCAIYFLSIRARSRREIINKLREKEFSDEIIDKTIQDLKNLGYIDDENFAKLFISDKRRLHQFGNEKLRFDLMRLGVDREIIDKYLDDEFYETDDDETELNAAMTAIKKKYKNNIDILKQKEESYKAAVYLKSRGFSYSIAKEAIKETIEKIIETEFDGD